MTALTQRADLLLRERRLDHSYRSCLSVSLEVQQSNPTATIKLLHRSIKPERASCPGVDLIAEVSCSQRLSVTWRASIINSGSASNQPFPPEKGKPGECPPDNNLAENSQENLDARLDHAIEETFPTSDPISVHITKGPEPDRQDQEAPALAADDHLDQSEQDPTEHLLDQVWEALLDVTDSVSGAAQDAYDQSSRYVRQAREQYPKAEQYIRKGQQAVTHRVTENPLLTVFMAGVAGYALGWVIHRERRDRGLHVPDHARTRRRYAPHQEN